MTTFNSKQRKKINAVKADMVIIREASLRLLKKFGPDGGKNTEMANSFHQVSSMAVNKLDGLMRNTATNSERVDETQR